MKLCVEMRTPFNSPVDDYFYNFYYGDVSEPYERDGGSYLVDIHGDITMVTVRLNDIDKAYAVKDGTTPIFTDRVMVLM